MERFVLFVAKEFKFMKGLFRHFSERKLVKPLAGAALLFAKNPSCLHAEPTELMQRIAVVGAPQIGCQVGRAHAPIGFEKARNFDVADIWSGVSVDFDAFVYDGALFAAYYDADRYMSVAEIVLATGAIERIRLDSIFEGWDAHNYVRIALDSSEAIHVTGNMHASPLVYFQGDQPLSITSLRRVFSLAGIGEDHVTYPTFLGGVGGPLALFYRSGRSGNGVWYIANWSDGRWKGDAPLFDDRFADASVSAYPSPPAKGQDDMTHLAIVWRRTPDAGSNFRLSYVRTGNFSEWYDLAGRRLALPINPNSASLVDDTGPNAGLLNSAQVGVSPQGMPFIAYTKYGPHGGNAIVVAAPESADSWRRTIIAESSRAAAISGGGTLPEAPGIHPVTFPKGGNPTITYAFANQPRLEVQLDPATLKPLAGPTAATDDVACYFRTHRTDLTNWRMAQHPVRDLSAPGMPIVGELIWEAQAAAMRDLPYPCTASQPNACRPPSTKLHFIYFPQF
jgi:hypothetical protein